MKRLFKAFPEVVLVDSTHDTNANRYKLFSFVVHDVFGKEQYVHHALVESGHKVNLWRVIEIFKKTTLSGRRFALTFSWWVSVAESLGSIPGPPRSPNPVVPNPDRDPTRQARAHIKTVTEAGLAAWTLHVDASSLHQRGVQHSLWRTSFLPHSRYRCSAARMASPAAEMAAPAATSKWTVTEELLRKRKNPVTPPSSDDYIDWLLEQLRLECTARRLNVKKNTCKVDRMQLLTAYDSNKSGVELLLQRQRNNLRREDQEEEKRTKNASGDQLSRSDFDRGGSTFWRDVAVAFAASDIEFDSLISDDAVFEDVDPSQFMVHSTAKLQCMWREVIGNFARAEACSKKSGNQSNDFWDFCDGRADVYNLDRWCAHRRAGREFCAANLYPEDDDDSQKEGMCKGNTGNRKRRKTSNTDTLASLAESVAQIVAHDQSDAETWKQQALLLHNQRMAHRLEMLTNVLNRTRDEERRLVQSGRDGCEEDENVDLMLQQTIKKRKLLTAQINDLELEIINAGVI
ncbi:hypothetical protein PF004_g19282 [Phytophthora fragariae]|uniref:ZSWIM1/3 RNaseH-like domain-containing protein n=2 Tax=Phytophthora fragariae TaxID=53985 RepID=A0A6G0N987_9STRA|nr:hypothetical protein PF004_g19282 [Phytophthora fragariae]